jgi:molybdopterin-binding protein
LCDLFDYNIDFFIESVPTLVSEVAIGLTNGGAVVASITKASVGALGLEVGDQVSAIVKASNVMIGV